VASGGKGVVCAVHSMPAMSGPATSTMCRPLRIHHPCEICGLITPICRISSSFFSSPFQAQNGFPRDSAGGSRNCAYNWSPVVFGVAVPRNPVQPAINPTTITNNSTRVNRHVALIYILQNGWLLSNVSPKSVAARPDLHNEIADPQAQGAQHDSR